MRVLVSAFLVALTFCSPAMAQQSAEDQRLISEVERIVAPLGGRWGVEVREVNGTRRFSYNADQYFHMASTVKLPLAVYAFHLADRRRLRLDRLVPIPDEHEGPGIISNWIRHPGAQLSVLNLLELMMTASDNDATDLVFKETRGPAPTYAWLQQKGLSEIRVSRTLRETFGSDDTGAAAAEDLRDRATPAAMAELLQRLAQRQLLSAENSDRLLAMMGRSRTGVARLPASLPAGVRVAHKSGTLIAADGVNTNSVGVVSAPDGRQIAVAIFSSQVPENTDEAARDAAIAHIARIAYDSFLAPADPASDP